MVAAWRKAERTATGRGSEYRSSIRRCRAQFHLRSRLRRPSHFFQTRMTRVWKEESDCELPVIDSVLACVLRDDAGQMSELLTIRAHLAHSEDVPLLLGFSSLLDRADVHFSVKKSKAYLEI